MPLQCVSNFRSTCSSSPFPPCSEQTTFELDIWFILRKVTILSLATFPSNKLLHDHPSPSRTSDLHISSSSILYHHSRNSCPRVDGIGKCQGRHHPTWVDLRKSHADEVPLGPDPRARWSVVAAVRIEDSANDQSSAHHTRASNCKSSGVAGRIHPRVESSATTRVQRRSCASASYSRNR